jgi:pyruvate dehydrogenase E1 component beta subunit
MIARPRSRGKARRGGITPACSIQHPVPLYKEMIYLGCKTNRVVIVQEAVRRGGVASDIASIIQAEAFYDLDAPIEIVAGLNIPVPFNLELEKASVPQVDDIVVASRRTLHATSFALAAE